VSTIPTWLHHIVDDAAIFPPGNAPLAEAVRAHEEHRTSGYADLVGPFVVSDVKLPDLIQAVSTGSTDRDGATDRDRETPEPLPIAVVVTGGAGAIEPAVRWASRSEVLDLRSVEVALRDEADLPHNARRVVTMVDQLLSSGDLDEEVLVYVEPPRLRAEPSHLWLGALDEVAAADHRLKFRTGGVDADTVPDAAELAACIGATLDRELPFKCTAGLHHALRHTQTEGVERPVDQHGFLNVLLATRASLEGGGTDAVAAVLDERDPTEVRHALDDLGAETLAATRRWFTGFGSCSVLEPLEDLVDLDLVSARAVGTPQGPR
jgi:hypothetical protein